MLARHFFSVLQTEKKPPQCTQPGLARPMDHADHVPLPAPPWEILHSTTVLFLEFNFLSLVESVCTEGFEGLSGGETLNRTVSRDTMAAVLCSHYAQLSSGQTQVHGTVEDWIC